MPALVRNKQAVLSQLVETEGGQVITKVPCRIQIPARYTEVNLAEISLNTSIYGCFVLILDSGEYTVCNVNSIIDINPYKTLQIKIDEVPYHEFYFEEGDVVIKSTSVVKRDNIMYNIFDEFLFKGKVPWFMEYEDMGKLFDTSKEYAGSNIGQNLEVIEFLAAIVGRTKNNRETNIRHSAESYKDISLKTIAFVPLMSLYYSINSTLNKLAGRNFEDGVTSALISKTTSVDTIERILRA